jgi:hypothetical protein
MLSGNVYVLVASAGLSCMPGEQPSFILILELQLKGLSLHVCC